MSEIADDMNQSSEITHARILNRLFDDKSKEFHTEINKPFAMSNFDAVQDFVTDELGEDAGKYLATWGDRYRTNMVAKDRKRAKEIIEGVKAELQREERELRDRMVGTLGR